MNTLTRAVAAVLFCIGLWCLAQAQQIGPPPAQDVVVGCAQMPALTGDTTSSAGSCATSTTKTGGVAFAPSATTDTTSASNISSGTLAAARGGAGTISGALKGNGSGTVSQAACGDLSNAGTACQAGTGTSGATLGFLNGSNTYSGVQIYGNADFAITDASAAHNVYVEPNSSTALTADRVLTVDMVNAARTLKLGANLTLATDPGAVSGAVKSNGSGTFTQAACGDLSNSGSGCTATVPTGAWTVGTAPTITCGSGAVGTYSAATVHYQITGKAVQVSEYIQAAIGTCSGSITISLPVTSGGLFYALPVLDTTTGFPAMCRVTNGQTSCLVYSVAGTNPTGSDFFIITGTYESS